MRSSRSAKASCTSSAHSRAKRESSSFAGSPLSRERTGKVAYRRALSLVPVPSAPEVIHPRKHLGVLPFECVPGCRVALHRIVWIPRPVKRRRVNRRVPQQRQRQLVVCDTGGQTFEFTINNRRPAQHATLAEQIPSGRTDEIRRDLRVFKQAKQLCSSIRPSLRRIPIQKFGHSPFVARSRGA